MNTEIIILYDIYGSLLTTKQQVYFEDYYFKNLTLSEISEKYSVSRNAVHKQLKVSEIKLIELEKILKINKKNILLNEVISSIKDDNLRNKLIEINDRM